MCILLILSASGLSDIFGKQQCVLEVMITTELLCLISIANIECSKFKMATTFQLMSRVFMYNT